MMATTVTAMAMQLHRYTSGYGYKRYNDGNASYNDGYTSYNSRRASYNGSH